MSRKRSLPDASNDAPASKKHKANPVTPNVKSPSPEEEERDLLADLDLDLNIVVGRHKNPIKLNFLSASMKDMRIDSHIVFQLNPKSSAHNILWQNKCVINHDTYMSFHSLISHQEPDYCHFHQPCGQQILQMYELAPRCLQDSSSCLTILYNIHKSVMSTVSELSYAECDLSQLKQTLINLSISSSSSSQAFLSSLKPATKPNTKKLDSFLETNKQEEASKSAKNSQKNRKNLKKPFKKHSTQAAIIEDYGFADNAFHKLSLEWRISPMQLVREYLKCKLSATPKQAKDIALLLSQKSACEHLPSVQANVRKLFKLELSLAELRSMFASLCMDCVRGLAQHVAWHGWNDKMRSTRDAVLCELLDRERGKGGRVMEHTLVGKLRAVLDKINEHVKDGEEGYRILNETEQRRRISDMKLRQIELYRRTRGVEDNVGEGIARGGKKKKKVELGDEEVLDAIGWRDPPTPDVLFNKPIMLNGLLVNWVDAKNYMVAFPDKIKWKYLMRQTRKYNRAFGNGAVVALGFVDHRERFRLKNDLMLLDGSYWKFL